MTRQAQLVIDANVFVDLLLNEGHFAQAGRLLADRVADELVCPPHLRGEVTHTLHRRTLRGTNLPITSQEAQQALTDFRALQPRTVEPDTLYEDAFTFAQANGLASVYDALYVVLAQLIGAEFWTADRRLVNQLAGAAPWVRFIGDYALPHP